MKKIGIIGLGYVGLGLATELSKHFPVVGYDIAGERIKELQQNIDTNELISEEELRSCKLLYSSEIEDIKDSNFYIVTVSTPAYFYEMPNLAPLISATKNLALFLKKGDIVVYESTVYPGTTEEICLPLLEEISQLKAGVDFNIGYSPERISPGDQEHSLQNITKIISAQNEHTLNEVSTIYKTICESVYPVSSIQTAEAVKILENTQRDTNIALMNEFSQIMHAIDLDVHEIIEAAKTKWSFVPFKPGFVGGHCIAVDPQYLAFKAKRVGVYPDLIVTSRKVNDGMPNFVMQELIKLLGHHNLPIKKATIGIFGLSYKENVKDARNSLALKLIKFLTQYGFHLQLHDPILDPKTMYKKYGHELLAFEEIQNLTLAVVVVGHDFYRKVGLHNILAKLSQPKILMDIPNLYIDEIAESSKKKSVTYWNL